MISRIDIEDMTDAQDKARAIAEAAQITMTYRNWRGEVAQRTIRPVALWFGKTDWHPDPGWMLSAWDCDKGERRDFALADCQFADLARPSQAGGRGGGMSVWQPIETAPEVDSDDPILVWDGYSAHVAWCGWHEDDKPVWFNGDVRVDAIQWTPLPPPPGAAPKQGETT